MISTLSKSAIIPAAARADEGQGTPPLPDAYGRAACSSNLGSPRVLPKHSNPAFGASDFDTNGIPAESVASAESIKVGIRSEMRRFSAKLEGTGHHLATLPESLAPLLGAKCSRGWEKNLEQVILSLAPSDTLNAVGVLAHDTAFKEIHAMLRAVDVLIAHTKVNFTLILTHWENLSAPVPDMVFDTIREGIHSILKTRPWSSNLFAVGRHSINTLAPFIQARAESWSPGEPPCGEDLKWMIDFYERKETLRPYGKVKAFHDFTLRRGLGLLIGELNPHFAILTEMTERLSRCYRCQCPALNVRP